MPLTGSNKKCQQCVGACKQWQQVHIVRCPLFRNNQKNDAEDKKRDTL